MGDNISGISYLNNIELLPVRDGVSLRSKVEILDRLLIDYTIASIAAYAYCSSYDLVKTFLTTLDTKFDISNIIKGKDKQLIINIFNKRVSKKNLEEITYRFESAYVCLWALGFTESINFDKKSSVKAINNVLLSSNKYNDLIDNSNLRSEDEILLYYSKIAKTMISDIEIDNKIVDNQTNALRFIILYNFNKDGLKLRYNDSKLRFEFKLPEELRFVNIPSNILFAFKGKDDLKILGQKIDADMIQDNISKLTINGFEVLDVDYVGNAYLDKRMLKVGLKKKEITVNSYYVYIDDYLIRIDFSINKRNIEEYIINTLKIFE